jgi:hypothetical protein
MLESVTNYVGSLLLLGFIAVIVSGFISVLIQKVGQAVSTIIMVYKTDQTVLLNKKEDND